MRSKALDLAMEDDPDLAKAMHNLAESLAATNRTTFTVALDALHEILHDYLIYVIEEEP